MDWHTALPKQLLDASYSAGKELAWGRDDALRVVKLLREKGFLVEGVDVWIPAPGGPGIPAPFVYDWTLGQQSGDRSRQGSAADFINGFEWDPTDANFREMTPYFNITARRGDT